jgi:hypothetical protein
MEITARPTDDDPRATDEGGPMRFLRRNKAEPEPPRCPVCRELLSEDAIECDMCGHRVATTDESERPETIEPAPPSAPR